MHPAPSLSFQSQSLIANDGFQHILRVLNTNVDGRNKIMYALTSIKGVGRRFANLVCKKADVDLGKRYTFDPVCTAPGILNLIPGPKWGFDVAVPFNILT